MSGVKNSFAVDAGVIIYLDRRLSARQYFADYDYRLTGLEKMPSTILAGVILLWSEVGLIRWRRLSFSPVLVPTLKMIAIARLLGCAKGHGKRDSERMHFIYEVVESGALVND